MMPWSPAPSSFFSPASTPCGDVGRLAVQQDDDLGRLPVEAGLLVADVLDGLAGRRVDLLLGDGGGTAGLARDHHVIGGRQGFAGHAHRPGVEALLQRLAVEQIDDLVGNPVAHLVRMTFRNRLAGEDEILA